MHAIHHGHADVGGQQLFYREAGPAGPPAVVLLHGFPASSFMFRDLIPRLADRYHVLARTISASACPARRRSASSPTPSMHWPA